MNFNAAELDGGELLRQKAKYGELGCWIRKVEG